MENQIYRDIDEVKQMVLHKMGSGLDNIDFTETPSWLDTAIHKYISKIISAVLAGKRPLGLFLLGPSRTGKTYAICRLMHKMLYDITLNFSNKNLTYFNANDAINKLKQLVKEKESFNKDIEEIAALELQLYPPKMLISIQDEYNYDRNIRETQWQNAQPVVIIDDLNTVDSDSKVEYDENGKPKYKHSKNLELMADYLDALKNKGVMLMGASNISASEREEQIEFSNDWERLWGRIFDMCYVIAAPKDAPKMGVNKL